MIQHTCGATIPADVTALVEHLAACPQATPEAHPDLGSICRQILHTVSAASRVETPVVSREMTPSDMAAMRDTGATYREIADVAGIAPETVRRRIAKHKRGES